MKSINVVFPLLVSILLTISSAFAEGKDRDSCQVCGMYIDQYQKTAGKLEYKTGEVVQSCGLACLLRLVQDAGGPDAFAAILVKDWVLGIPFPAQEATYVISSKVIPDMLPSIIAFKEPEDAEHFKEENGGELINFTQALMVISPSAMTMPARIKTAVLPAKGASGLGLGFMTMTMDKVVTGTDSTSPSNFIKRTGQMMGPKKMTNQATMLMVSYGLTDTMAVDVKASYLDKKMEMYTMGGKDTTTTKHSGISDTYLSYRYSLYKSGYYNHFFALLAQASLPTGEFDTEYLKQPGLQNGTGDFTYGGGLLYTYRYDDIWLHSMVSYTHILKNSDDYKFGDQTRFGVALHYTPNYDWMLGVESDTVYFEKNEYNGIDVGNTGGTRSMLTGVTSWRFLTALGGNFNLRLTAGIPVYQNLNDTAMPNGMQAVQMGGGWFGSLSISFKRRYTTN